MVRAGARDWRGLNFRVCSHMMRGCSLPEGQQSNMKPKTPTRQQLRQALETFPDAAIFGTHASKTLTAKQKKFAKAVAMGATKADAYRQAYDVTSKASMVADPYRIANNPSVRHEIEALQQAMKAMEYQTPSSLRALVINSLVKVITDPDAKPGQIVNAAKVLGNVTEVAAFTDRKEIRTITSSESAREQIMMQLRELVKSQADDATVIDNAADSLLAELSGMADTHPPATPHAANGTPGADIHTIPHERSSSSATSPEEEISPPADPTPSAQEDPPVDGTVLKK